MDQQILKNILEKHRKWVLGESDGERADLSSADLRYADLRDANLSSADLRYADLRYANLSSADLRYADLRYADLSSADLRYADLSSADHKEIKEDFFKRLDLAKSEVGGLYDFIIRGKINGTAYQGECACFVGTIANLRRENYEQLTCQLKPDADSLTERWFLVFEPGITPDWHPVAKITKEWMDQYMTKNEIVVPKYKLISSLEKPELFGLGGA